MMESPLEHEVNLNCSEVAGLDGRMDGWMDGWKMEGRVRMSLCDKQ